MWATHRVSRNGSRPVSSRDDTADAVVYRTNNIVIRTLAFKMVIFRHGIMNLKA